MRLRAVAIAMLALSAGGCGQSSDAANQQRVLAYQVQIGRINAPFAHPSTAVKASERMLAHAIAEYQKLHVPSAVAGLNRSLVASLSAELGAVRAAASASAAGNSAHLAAAVKLDARARTRVAAVLATIGRRVNACRNNAARC